jgi:hypothetical protein
MSDCTPASAWLNSVTFLTSPSSKSILLSRLASPKPKVTSHAHNARGSRCGVLVYIDEAVGGKRDEGSGFQIIEEDGRMRFIFPRIAHGELMQRTVDAMIS